MGKKARVNQSDLTMIDCLRDTRTKLKILCASQNLSQPQWLEIVINEKYLELGQSMFNQTLKNNKNE